MKKIHFVGYMSFEKQIFIMQIAELLSQQYKVLIQMDTDLTKLFLLGNQSTIVEVRGVDLCLHSNDSQALEYDFILTNFNDSQWDEEMFILTQNYLDLQSVQSALSNRKSVGDIQVLFLHWCNSRIKPRYIELLFEPYLGAYKMIEVFMHEFDERDFTALNEHMLEIRGALKSHTKAYKKALLIVLSEVLSGKLQEAKALLQKGEKVK